MDVGIVKKLHVLGLFKNVQMQGAQKTEPRGVYGYTLSSAVCSATQQMSVFEQPHSAQLRRNPLTNVNPTFPAMPDGSVFSSIAILLAVAKMIILDKG